MLAWLGVYTLVHPLTRQDLNRQTQPGSSLAPGPLDDHRCTAACNPRPITHGRINRWKHKQTYKHTWTVVNRPWHRVRDAKRPLPTHTPTRSNLITPWCIWDWPKPT